MTITLPVDLDQFLQAEVSAGRFASVSDAVCEAVRALQQQRKMDSLRAEIQIADEEFQRGEFISAKDGTELREILYSLRQQWVTKLPAEEKAP